MQTNKPSKFTLVINSTNYFQRFNNTLNDQSYTIDNTNLESGFYKCRLSFRGNTEFASTIGPVNNYASIYLSMGAPLRNYVCDDKNVFQNSTLVGFSNVYVISETTANNRAYCSASYDTNPPFYLEYKVGNVIRVTLKAGTSANLFAGGNNYLLFIEMVKISENEDEDDM